MQVFDVSLLGEYFHRCICLNYLNICMLGESISFLLSNLQKRDPFAALVVTVRSKIVHQ